VRPPIVRTVTRFPHQRVSANSMVAVLGALLDGLVVLVLRLLSII
jgi:hypothetical protein